MKKQMVISKLDEKEDTMKKKVIGDRIRRLREASGLILKDVADVMDCGETLMHLIEKGKRNKNGNLLSKDERRILSEFLGVDEQYLNKENVKVKINLNLREKIDNSDSDIKEIKEKINEIMFYIESLNKKHDKKEMDADKILDLDESELENEIRKKDIMEELLNEIKESEVCKYEDIVKTYRTNNTNIDMIKIREIILDKGVEEVADIIECRKKTVQNWMLNKNEEGDAVIGDLSDVKNAYRTPSSKYIVRILNKVKHRDVYDILKIDKDIVDYIEENIDNRDLENKVREYIKNK